MEDLMSQILFSAAREKRSVEDTPLDLTTTKILRHTCDSLIEQGDLRLGTDSNSEIYYRVKREPSDGDLFNNICRTDIKGLHVRDESVQIHENPTQIKKEEGSPFNKQEPHPFSIEALLGDVDKISSDGHTANAVVYSSYCSYTSCTTFNEETLSGSHMSGNDDSYWCHVCNELCTSYKDAQGHKYLHYVQGAKCNLKKVLFIKHGYVSKHMRVDDEKIQCGLCDKIVAYCFFTKHQRLHDGHFCEICNKEFSSSSRLLDHMNIHTGSTPFSCKICNRKFAKRSSLTQHQRYHRDHQSFKCGYCPKAFNSKYARAVHERLHTGENPFKCQVPGCSREFPQKIQLQLHMNSH